MNFIDRLGVELATTLGGALMFLAGCIFEAGVEDQERRTIFAALAMALCAGLILRLSRG